MKNTVTISSIAFGTPFTNAKGQQVTLVYLSTLEKYERFEQNDDGEKVLISERMVKMNLSDFKRLFVLNPYLCHVGETRLTEAQSQLEDSSQNAVRYEKQVDCLLGAKLTIVREEVKSVVYSDKIRLDEKGKEVVDPETGEVLFEPLLDKDGKPVTKLIGFGDTSYESLVLDPVGIDLAKDYIRAKTAR